MRFDRPSGGTCTTMRLAPPDQSSASVAPPRVNRPRAGGVAGVGQVALVGAVAGDDPRKFVVGAFERSEPPALVGDRDGEGGEGRGRMALALVTAHGLLVVGDVAAQRGQLCRMVSGDRSSPGVTRRGRMCQPIASASS